MPLASETDSKALFGTYTATLAQRSLATSFNRLSSGFRIDAQGRHRDSTPVSEGIRSRLNAYASAERNANDAMALAQTANDGLSELRAIAARMRDRIGRYSVEQSSDGRAAIASQVEALQSEVRRVFESTVWNGKPLLARDQDSFEFSLGPGAGETKLPVVVGGIDARPLLRDAPLADPRAFADSVDAFGRALDASQKRFADLVATVEGALSNIQTARLNIAAAGSRIEDVADADDSAHRGSEQVLANGESSVMAQANYSPQVALNLLR